MGFKGKNSLKISDEKKNRNIILDLLKNPWNTRPLKTTTDNGPCKQ